LKGIPQGRYTREFRQEAVKLVIEEGLSLPEAGRRLSLAPSTLAYWVKAYKSGKLGEIGKAQKPLTEVEIRHHIFAFRSQDTYPYARAKTEVNQEKGQVIPCQC
jgi:transposase-like protein